MSVTPASAHLFSLIKTDNHEVTCTSNKNWDHDFNYWNHFVFYQQRDHYDWRTDLVTVQQPRRVWNNSTDVVWHADALGDWTNGDEICKVVVWYNGRCDRAEVRFNQALTGRLGHIGGFRLACHELGHAYGFDHNTDGNCMSTDLPDVNNLPLPAQINQQVIDHINAQY